MFGPRGPSLIELTRQALSSTERGYDLLAPKFDATPFRTPSIVLERALEDLGEVDDALDLCCGTGAGLLALAPGVRRRLVGIDFSERMLEVARRSLAAAGPHAAVELVHADVFAMDFDDCFDVVTCFGALGHLPEARMPELSALVHRALRPGGRFVFVTAERPPALSVRSLVSRAFNGAMHLRNAIFDPPFHMYYLRFLLPEAARVLEAAGFDCAERPLAGVPGAWTRGVVVVATRR